MKDHAHPHPESEKQALKTRLHRLVGQLKAVESMVDEDRDCAEVLMLLVSVRKALKGLSEKLIHTHMHYCIEGARDRMDSKKKMRELMAVLERYVE